MKIYQIGGSVRDKIMKIVPHDFDYVVVGSSVKKMIELGYKQVGKNFPVFINPQNGCEYALARKEIKTGPKHTDFQFIFDETITLKQDTERRDFTCNAIAYDEENDILIDYHNGISDINDKILRHINSKHFIEDPLRILRVCRFAAQLNFSIAPETMELAKDMVNNEMLKHLSPERIWQEIFKALKTQNFDKFILTAKKCGALNYFLPEIEQLFSIPERTETHPEKTVGNHTIMALKYAAKFKPEIKFAVLMHDIGKLKTPKNKLPFHSNHHLDGVTIINQICNRLRIPNSFKKFAVLSCRYHTDFAEIEKISYNELVNLADALSQSTINDFIKVCEADFFGRAIKYPTSKFKIKENILNKTTSIIWPIKATDMPNLNQISEKQIIKEKLKTYKISILQKNLTLS